MKGKKRMWENKYVKTNENKSKYINHYVLQNANTLKNNGLNVLVV